MFGRLSSTEDDRDRKGGNVLARYPELAQQWQNMPMNTSPVRPEELTDPTYQSMPHAAHKDFMPTCTTGAAEAAWRQWEKEASRVNAVHQDMCRLNRQFLFECHGIHPDGVPQSHITVGQLQHGIHKLQSFQAQSSTDWVANPDSSMVVVTSSGAREETVLSERPQMLKALGISGQGHDTLCMATAEAHMHMGGTPIIEQAIMDEIEAIRDEMEAEDAHIKFTEHRGALVQGGDIFQSSMTVAEAKKKCRELPACRGFTFNGTDVDSPVPVMCYFKAHFIKDDSMVWTSVHADWTDCKSHSIDALLSIALPAYMNKSAGTAAEHSSRSTIPYIAEHSTTI